MGTIWDLVRVGIVAAIVVAVAEMSKRTPRYGALLLSLPIVSILAFLGSWLQHRDMVALSRLARETLILVPLGLPFFVPFALAERTGCGFGSCLVAGILFATLTTGAWIWLGPAS